MTTADDNASSSQPTRDHEWLSEMTRRINDKSLPWPERDAAKNELLLAHVEYIWEQVFNRTGGRVGISDHPTELGDSAFARLKESASNIAQAVEAGSSLLAAIAQRIKWWAIDKIRRSDGQTDKRGKGKQKHPVTALDNAEGQLLPPDEEVAREETRAQIKAAVFGAVADLDGDEQAVILGHFGLDGPEMLLLDIADVRGISLIDAHNAFRRAKDKLRNWLKKHDPNEAIE